MLAPLAGIAIFVGYIGYFAYAIKDTYKEVDMHNKDDNNILF